MNRTPSKQSVLKLLRDAGFPMEAVIEMGRGRIEIGYLTDAKVEPADRERTAQATTVAEELLGWGGYCTGYGSWVLRHDYEPDSYDSNDRCSRHHY